MSVVKTIRKPRVSRKKPVEDEVPAELLEPIRAAVNELHDQIVDDIKAEKERVGYKPNSDCPYGDYIEEPWAVIGSYFRNQHLRRLVRHQLESYNHFISRQIPDTINMFNPVCVKSEHDYDRTARKHSLELYITFTNFQLMKPQIYENNGATKVMFPQEARLRNFTYSSAMTVDVNVKTVIRTGEDLSQEKYLFKTIPNVHIGKLPIMLKSDICMLTLHPHVSCDITGECHYDAGGYFIINGSEKTVLGQDRSAENRVYCFDVSRTNNKWLYTAEVKSVPDFRSISPKQITIMLSAKNTGLGNACYIQIPRMRDPIPVFALFRAMGVITDKDICNYIVNDINNPNNAEILNALRASIDEGSKIMTQDEAFNHIVAHAMFVPMNMDSETGKRKKIEFANDILDNDLFPHCKTKIQKIYYLGYMVNCLIRTSLGMMKFDDRDSFINKRVDTTGELLNKLFRNYFNKFVKDLQKMCVKEINTGSWRSSYDYNSIINYTNIYRLVRSATLENGLKKALSTGDFGVKHTNSNKVGVAQVLNRLAYVSSLSHLRRVNTPIDKSGKLVPPRKLHNSSWGFMCPAETPEGQSVGLVKNLSYMVHVTISTSSTPIYDLMHNLAEDGLMTPFSEEAPISGETIDKSIKVFVNGNWIGISQKPMELYTELKNAKHRGIINIYTGVVFDFKNGEIRLCTDSGRPMRPLLRVKNGNILLTKDIARRLGLNDGDSELLEWDDLLLSNIPNVDDAILEYIDAEEQNYAMIAMTPHALTGENAHQIKTYTHCEIHPSTIFGVLASCIPFPDHNQSPRNTYQCAMGKQAMGTYVTNYRERMDKTSYVLTTTMRPLVDTRIMNLLKFCEIPSGQMVIVAIATHTGFNQEDSLIMNEGSIRRGLFSATIYHTEKDEEKKGGGGDEEILCKPDPQKTKGMKFANYEKLTEKGLVPENTLINNRDVIIGKVVPIKEYKNDPTKRIKYANKSHTYKTTNDSNEDCYIDKNYVSRGGEGYPLCKTRIRTHRQPVIGDKFCALPTQQVLTSVGWVDIKDVTLRHEVATLGANKELVYERPVEVVNFAHDGHMCVIETPQLHIICTPNHKLYVSDKNNTYTDNDEYSYRLREAQEVLNKRVRFQKMFRNTMPDLLTMGASSFASLTDAECWLNILGRVVSNHSRFGRGEFRKIGERITLEMLHHMEIVDAAEPVTLTPHMIGDITTVVSNSRLPDYVWKLSSNQAYYLLMTVTNSMASYTTHSADMANEIQRLATHANISATIMMKKTLHMVRLCLTNNQPYINKGERQTIGMMPYNGRVYCLTMPTSHVYYMRETPFSPPCIIGNSSRHGQKGTVGMVLPESDMPFTRSGLKPDIIINPHAIPSRMTIGQLKETLLGKVLLELGMFGDGTSFNDLSVDTICAELSKLGHESYGNELLYNGMDGTQMETSIFIGPAFYQRLKHMVNDKQHSRSIGPMVVLTRQPAEGRSRDGGLRFGEMERDCMVSHGASNFLRDRMYYASDKYSVHACRKCGMIAAFNNQRQIHECKTCDNRVDFAYVEIPYACKLLFQELMAMNIAPRIVTA